MMNSREQAALRLVTANGYEFHYTDQGQGQALVLLHPGGATDYRTWNAQVEAFSEQYRVIAYSRRYHYPNATHGAGPEWFDSGLHAADLAAILDALQIERAALVANSHGGDVALLFALEHPERVGRLVVGEPALLSWLPGLPGGKGYLARYLDQFQMAYMAALRGDTTQAGRHFIDSALGEGAFDRMPASTRSRVVENAVLLAIKRPALEKGRTLTCQEAGEIRAPTLLVSGDHSPHMFLLIMDVLARCMPGAERAIIPNASHLMYSMNPQIYNAIVLAYLKKYR
jgi:non-heme chloroperoxidase